MRRLRMIWCAGVVAGVLMPALADVPPAMDRAPEGAPVVVSIRNMEQLKSSVEKLVKSLNLPGDGTGIEELDALLATPGLDPGGSMALVMLSAPQDGEEPPGVAIVAVKDYGALVKNFGGQGAGVEAIEVDGQEHFVKDLGGGFAVLGDKKELVEAFEGKAGHAKAFEKLMGANGKAVADGANAFVFANLQALAPQMKQGIEEMGDQMAMMAQMGGNAAGQVAFIKGLCEELARDGQAGVIGLNIGDAGVKLDMAGQFKEGSAWAGYFTTQGNAGELLGHVPSMPFLFAMAADTSSPGIKKCFQTLAEGAAKANEGAAGGVPGMDWAKQIEQVDGMAFVLGAPQALMGAIFSQTLMYAKTRDPAGYIASMKESMAKMNGQAANGITYKTTYEPGGATVAGVPVDAWSMQLQVDPTDPNAQAMQMPTAMMFGPAGGPSGYIAPAAGGVVVTYSKNAPLMEAGMNAAKAGKGLGGEASIGPVAQQLPPGRTFEGYIGVKSILEAAIGFMAMMGGPGPEFQIPENLSPIGIGGTTSGGGVRVTTYVPSSVIQTIAKLAQEMQGPEPENMDGEADESGQGRF